jgi:hypothetical protein
MRTPLYCCPLGRGPVERFLDTHTSAITRCYIRIKPGAFEGTCCGVSWVAQIAHRELANREIGAPRSVVAGAMQHVDGVGQQVGDEFEGLDGAFRAAG